MVLAEIMTANSFAEVMWLIAFVLFVVEVIRLIAVARGSLGLFVVAGGRRSGLDGARFPRLDDRGLGAMWPACEEGSCSCWASSV